MMSGDQICEFYSDLALKSEVLQSLHWEKMSCRFGFYYSEIYDFN